MHRLKILESVSAWGLILLGCVHNFIAAPMAYDAVSERTFWFVGAGLALWYAGAMNLVRRSAPACRTARIASLLTNVTLLAFVTAFGIYTGAAGDAGGILLDHNRGDRQFVFSRSLVRSADRGRPQTGSLNRAASSDPAVALPSL